MAAIPIKGRGTLRVAEATSIAMSLLEVPTKPGGTNTEVRGVVVCCCFQIIISKIACG